MASASRGLAGAASGAAIGSAFSPVGTAIGAGVGGLLGLFGGGDDSQSNQQAAWLQPYWQSILRGEGAPQFNATDPAGRNAQVDALGRMNALSQTGMDPQQALANKMALAQGSQLASGREGAIRADLQARGQGAANSGSEAAMRAQAGQMGAERVSMGQTSAAADAANRRAQMLRDYFSGGQAVRAGDFANSQALNDFNMRNWQSKIGAAGAAGGQANMGWQNAMANEDVGRQNTQQALWGANQAAQNLGRQPAPAQSAQKPAPVQPGIDPNYYSQGY